MNIVHVVLGKANPQRMNGVNKVAHNLALHQKRAGEDVEVWGITSTPSAETPSREYTLRLFPPFVAHAVPPRALLEAIRRSAPGTMFHFHGSFIPEFGVLATLLKLLGRKYVVTPHGALMPQAMKKSPWLKSTYFRVLEGPILRRAQSVHLLNPSELLEAQKLVPDARLFVAPNGQNLEEVLHEEQVIEADRRPVFGFCGRLSWTEKGIDLLLRGFAEYRRSGGGGILWLMGDGPDSARTRELALELEIAEHVVLWGPVFGERKLNMIRNCDAFFHPSRHEGFPLSVLEAAALGRPLVVSRYTNVDSYVESFRSGIVLAENTASEVASAMKVIQANLGAPLLEEMGRNAREMILRELNWPRVVERIRAEYVRP